MSNTNPSAIERAIEAQHYALLMIQGEVIPAGSLVGLLDTAQIKAMFAVQNLYEQLEKRHGEALAEIAALRADKARLDWLDESEFDIKGTYIQCWHFEVVDELPKTIRQAIDAEMNKSLNEITLSKIT